MRDVFIDCFGFVSVEFEAVCLRPCSRQTLRAEPVDGSDVEQDVIGIAPKVEFMFYDDVSE